MLATFEGSEAIYREQSITALVRLHDIRFRESGVFANVELVPTPGLLQSPERWKISSAWDNLTLLPRSGTKWFWAALYPGWSIYFDAEVIRTVVAIGANFSEDESFWDRYHKLSEYLNDAYYRACEFTHPSK